MSALKHGNLAKTLCAGLADWRNGWSMGGPGAQLDYRRGELEPEVITRSFVRATTRGAIRLDPVDGILPVMQGSAVGEGQGATVALCLPQALALRSARSVLTRLGPDRAAIRPRDRKAILYDLGFGLPQADVCIRTADPDLLAALEAGLGQSLQTAGNSLLARVVLAAPHRVTMTSLGRIEAYQASAGAFSHGAAKLVLVSRNAAAAPQGYVVCGSFHAVAVMGGFVAQSHPDAAFDAVRARQYLADDVSAHLRAKGA